MTKPQPAALFGQLDWSPRAFISWRGLVMGLLGSFSLMLAYRMYQQVFGWSAGLDATAPAFDTYWMNLLKGELAVLVTSWAGLWSYLWLMTRLPKFADRLSLPFILAVAGPFILPVPTVALVQGACFGGGTGLITACHIVVAADNARFAITEVRWGLVAAISVPQLVDASGLRQVRRYALTGERSTHA